MKKYGFLSGVILAVLAFACLAPIYNPPTSGGITSESDPVFIAAKNDGTVHRGGYSAIATSGGLTVLTVSDPYTIVFTGSATHFVKLPAVATLYLGFQFFFQNNSTDNVTVSSSGNSLIATMLPGQRFLFSCVSLSGTSASSWTYASGIPITYLDADGALTADSDARVATQKAVKTYSDTKQTAAQVQALIDAAVPYKVYTALLTQSGTDVPVATVLQNTLGGTVVWTRADAGAYLGTLSGAFPSSGTVCGPRSAIMNPTPESVANFEDLTWGKVSRESNDAVNVSTFAMGAASDDILNNALVEIRVYP